jgi:hypothetical protein
MSDASAGPSTSSSGGPAPRPPTGPLAGAEWPARAADLVEEVVGAVHDRVIRPLLVAGRVLVFGLLVGTMALVLGVLVAVAAIRLLDTYAFGHRVWASDLVVGGALTLVGLLAWSRRKSGRAEER